MHAARDQLDPARPDSPPAALSPPPPPPQACCRRCDSDVSRVVGEARYCPRCGLRLNRPTEGPDGGFSNVVTRGYASAMLRLGTHYELRHNEHEAVRCYDKSARLGDVTARVRLIDVAIAKRVPPLAAELDGPGTAAVAPLPS